MLTVFSAVCASTRFDEFHGAGSDGPACVREGLAGLVPGNERRSKGGTLAPKIPPVCDREKSCRSRRRKTPIGEHGALADNHALDHLGACAAEAIVLDEVPGGLQRLEHAADADAAERCTFLPILRAGADGRPVFDMVPS